MKIWLSTRLQPQGYIIFQGDLQSYSNSPSLFAHGFISPFRQPRIKMSSTFCLDATYSITQRSDEILYTIVIRDGATDRGVPCGYMITNDHSLGPIVQWLQHLKDNNLIVDPKQFTIDRSTAETNAIDTIFPGCQIQYCPFHVSQAWYRQLNTKVKYGGSAADDRMVRGEVMASLKAALYEESLTVFFGSS